MLYIEIFAVSSQLYTKYKYRLWAERRHVERLNVCIYSDHCALNVRYIF